MVMRKGIPVDRIDIPNRFRTVCEAEVREAIVKRVDSRLLEHGPSEADEPLPLSFRLDCCLTYDRPESLREMSALTPRLGVAAGNTDYRSG